MAQVSADSGRCANICDLVVPAATTSPTTKLVLQPAATVKTALMCLEIYRRGESWPLRAVGQGYDDLAGLARDS